MALMPERLLRSPAEFTSDASGDICYDISGVLWDAR